jgi:hypothetical protein
MKRTLVWKTGLRRFWFERALQEIVIVQDWGWGGGRMKRVVG